MGYESNGTLIEQNRKCIKDLIRGEGTQSDHIKWQITNQFSWDKLQLSPYNKWKCTKDNVDKISIRQCHSYHNEIEHCHFHLTFNRVPYQQHPFRSFFITKYCQLMMEQKLYHTFQTSTELITHLIHNNAHFQIQKLYVLSFRNSHLNTKYKAKLRHHEYVPVKNCTW